MYEMDGQVSLFDQDSSFGKMSPEHSVPTKDKTSELSSKKSQKLSTKMPLFLCLQKTNGQQAEQSWEMGGALLGEYSMHSFGESPNVDVESHLSQILEVNAPKKYYLSATACLGILRRARRRGKEIPFLLHEALMYMIFKEDENGQKGIADTIEILRKMWCEIGEEDLKEWIQRTFVLVQSEEVLLSEMCEPENTNEYTNERVLVEGDSKANDFEEGLCNMRCEGEIGDTPQRREPNEQLSKELDLLMQKLSFEDAQTEVIMYCLRIVCEGETSVFETLPTVSEGEIVGVYDRDGKAYGFPLGFRPENVRCYEEKSTTLCVGTRARFCNGIVTSEANYIDVEMEVAVRKYEVDCKALCECLREHKAAFKFNNKGISEKLDRPITEVEHWFRNDKYFAIPSPDVWYDLKELLGITTDEFDQSITEFEFKGCNYDMSNRIHIGNTSPTLSCECGNTLFLVPEVDSQLPCVVMDRSAYNQGANAKFNIGIDENGVAFSCIAKGPGAVCYIDTSHADDVVRTDEVVAPLQARDYKGVKYVFCLQGNGIDRADTAGCNGKGWKEGTCYTLNTIDRPAVVYQKPHYIVRRLTPLECERLQGFPDGWTDIGEYVDSKGKVKKTSDSARYKALGNSIALPPWKWIIKRLCSHYERDATMASLFDGIGGFPQLWEQINGKGFAIWASEIEDFPIAVTKKRIE